MSILHLDFETYSDLDLRVVGAYRYAEHKSTEILLAAWSLDDGPIQQWQPHLTIKPPSNFISALSNDAVFIMAHNAEFERRILIEIMGINVPRARYLCTAIRAAAAGLPRGLDGALAALGHTTRKDRRGANALRKFSRPRKPTKKHSGVRLYPADDPEAWQILCEYNKQDVVAEKALDKAIPDLPPREWRYYHYICKVNDRGLPLDKPTLEGASKVITQLEADGVRRVNKLTGVNPTQVEKLRQWLITQEVELPNLQLKTIEQTLRDKVISNAAREVLSIRVEASKASTKKIKAMLSAICDDGRAHGTLLPYGAHTGRLSGKLIQPHNFTRGLLGKTEEEKVKIQAMVLDMFRAGLVNIDLIRALLWHQPDDTPSGRPPMQGPMSMLAQCMRGFIRAPEGYQFYIVDYAAIEARILAWLANEIKLLIAFRNNVDTYKMMASVLYRVPIEEVTEEQRRIGKNLRLGAGYQLGPPKLIEHCEKEEIFIDLPFAKTAIKAFRDDNPNIVRSWYDCEEAAIRAVQNKRQVRAIENRELYFEVWRDWLLLHLPSRRKIHYYAPKTEMVVKFGKPKLCVTCFGERKKGMKGRIQTYGGMWIENVCQAIARDIMMEGMLAGEEAGYPALANIHDEDLTIRKIGEGNIKELEKAVCTMPRWAQEIPLGAKGFTAERYRKG